MVGPRWYPPKMKCLDCWSMQKHNYYFGALGSEDGKLEAQRSSVVDSRLDHLAVHC